jgi:molybdate transport system permease protein
VRSRLGRAGARLFPVALIVAVAVTLLFLALPVIAIFTDVSPKQLLDSLDDPATLDALGLSLQTTLTALVIILVVGTPVAWALATRRFRGKQILVTIIELPLVLPPAVAGIGLLAALGPKGILGPALDSLGIALVFQTAGVVVALTFVASPFYLRQVAFTSLLSGAALAWGRALGEFGATLVFAGSFQGVTQTAPLAIYAQFGTNFPAALALAAVLVAFSVAILGGVKLLGRLQPT